MKLLLKAGDQKKHRFVVKESDTATFANGTVHPVCATFTLAREIEWATRLFVLDILEEGEEGIGTKLTIQHVGAAKVGSLVEITATVISLIKNQLICSYEAKVADRIIAIGETGQKILKKEKLTAIFEAL